MRTSILATIPVLALLNTVPAEAQVSARLHLDVPVGRRVQVGHAAPRQRLVVREYDPYRFGAWENYYDQWVPETVYLYNGDYYDYPIVAYAEPIVVYRYRNEIFFAPRQRAFTQWRDNRGYRDIGREYRPAPRGVGEYRSREFPRGNEGRQFRPAPQNGRNERDGRGDHGTAGGAPRDGRGDHGNAGGAPRDGHNDRGMQGSDRGTQGGNGSSRGGDRTRPQGHH